MFASLRSWQLLNDEIGDDINEGDFLILYNEMHEHLESMHNSGNQISKWPMYDDSKSFKDNRSIQRARQTNGF